MRLQSIAKSLLIAVAVAGLASFFLMMSVIPVMALLQRLGGNIAQKSVVVNPSAFMRTYGLAVVVVVFVIAFALSMRRIHRLEKGTRVRLERVV
jgi:fumarate reductase subunit D